MIAISKTLSPIEKKLLPLIKLGSAKDIEAQGVDPTLIRRAALLLEKKGLISVRRELSYLVKLDVNGVLYLKQGLPERRLLNLLLEAKELEIAEAQQRSGLTRTEFQAAIGALKLKGFAAIEEGKIKLKASKEEAIKSFPEEKFLEALPLKLDALTQEQKDSLKALQKRKAIVRTVKEEQLYFELTPKGKEVLQELKKLKPLIEQLTPEMLERGTWKGKAFRAYDLTTKPPALIGGRKHFYSDFLTEVKQKLVALGFEELEGPLIVNEFWNFDALFQPQFHPAREWTDTYSVKTNFKITEELLPNKKIISKVKEVHEKVWRYTWKKEKAMQLILRPQGTVLSALKLASKPKVPGKYFALARCFRPEIPDPKHLPEFNQLEGIVIGKNLNFRHLLGMLKLLVYELIEPEEIKFLPDYFPFTEPSVEIQVKKGEWTEIGGAGIFRDEITYTLMQTKEPVKVLAWGFGLDRLAQLKFGLSDIRDLFSQNLEFLRKIKYQK